MSVVIGYHHDQMVAQSALADKVDFPERVVIQEFSSDAHENILNEVSVLAEASVDHAVRVDVGNDQSPRLVDAIPIYPVSRQAMPIAESLLAYNRRPVARDDAPRIAIKNKLLAQIERIPFGVMVFEAVEGSDPVNIEHLYLGVGVNGPLVDLSGIHIGGSLVLQKASKPFAEKGVRVFGDALVVSPYLKGRSDGPLIRDFTALQESLLWAAAFMIAFGLASMFSLFPSFRKAKKVRATQVQAVGAFPAVDPFEPIADQDELGQEDETTISRASRALTATTNAFRSKSQP